MKMPVYLISGPVGVGKSTLTRILSARIERAARIEGDVLMAMFDDKYDRTWEERLAMTWDNIAAVTRTFVRGGHPVVIDYVVEEELEWFRGEMAELGAELRYVVLTAEEDAVMDRIRSRGDIHMTDRSLFLLRKLRASEANAPYLLETTGRRPEDLAEEILHDPGFILNRP